MNPDPPPPGPKNVLPYGVAQPRPGNTFLHFLLIVLGTIAAFIAAIVGFIALLDGRSIPARMAGGTAVAGVLGWMTYLIVRSWLQKRRIAAAAMQNLPPAPPLTRKQKVRLAIGAVVFWAIVIALKLLPHLLRH